MATIIEDYVSFETAKLLKEKGFDIPCMFLYFAKYNSYGDFRGNFNETKNSEINELSYSAPTLQMTMKWLREVHSLHIWIGHSAGKGLSWYYEIHGISDGKVKHIGGIQCGSYEVACEEAIKFCLKNLI